MKGKTIKVLFDDTGSHFNVIRKDVFDQSHLGKMKPTVFVFNCVGSSNKAIGGFEVIIDDCKFKDICYVVAPNFMQNELSIRMSLMDQADEIFISKEGIKFKKIADEALNDEKDKNAWNELPICAVHL